MDIIKKTLYAEILDLSIDLNRIYFPEDIADYSLSEEIVDMINHYGKPKFIHYELENE